MKFKASLPFLLFLLMSCGSQNNTAQSSTDGLLIIEAGGQLNSSNLNLPSEGTLTIINHDEIDHTLTSESAPDAFDNTGDFDIIIPAESINILTLPSASSGTQYNFYCRFVTTGLSPANGTITIE